MQHFDDIISVQELSNILYDKDLVVIDCRFELMKPDQGLLDYQLSHIPGAYYAHLDHDLASPVRPDTGRHPLPEINEFSKKLAHWQIDKSKQVVVYDNSGGSIAVRLWWLLQYYGFEHTAVLDGGYSRWQLMESPVSSEIPQEKTSSPIPSLSSNSKMVVLIQEMSHLFVSPEYKIIDARSPIRYQGKEEPIDVVAGHIPGALNRFHGMNLQENGTLKSKKELHQEFSELIKDTPIDKVVFYCGSGVTSCHHILALKIAGIKGARLYAGSWSEWIRDPGRPVVRD